MGALYERESKVLGKLLAAEHKKVHCTEGHSRSGLLLTLLGPWQMPKVGIAPRASDSSRSRVGSEIPFLTSSWVISELPVHTYSILRTYLMSNIFQMWLEGQLHDPSQGHG
jgi:hypothetical protein